MELEGKSIGEDFFVSDNKAIDINEDYLCRHLFRAQVGKEVFVNQSNYVNMTIFWKLFREYFGLTKKDALYRNETMDASSKRVYDMHLMDYFELHEISRIESYVSGYFSGLYLAETYIREWVFKYIFRLHENLVVSITDSRIILYYPYDKYPDEKIFSHFREIRHRYAQIKRSRKGWLTFLGNYNWCSDTYELLKYRIKPVDKDILKYYNNDLVKLDKPIRKLISNLKESGIILFHGIPGTGKTTYVRYIISTVEAYYIYIAPHEIKRLINSNHRLSERKNAVLIIDDAESLLTESNLKYMKNLFDWLFEKYPVKVILSFNIPLHMIISQSREYLLSARFSYEFKELSEEKTRALCPEFDFSEERTLANIFWRE